MQKISKLISKAIGNNSTTLVLSLGLAKSWEHIVGGDLKDLSSFRSVVYIGKGKVAITINVLSSAIMLAQYNEPNIIERVKYNFKIDSVKLVFKHSSEIKTKNKSLENSNNLKIKRCILTEQFENQKLKSALENLKTELQHAA
ncbi:MAG: hypothetical protein LBU35_00855 [Holosporales bacterium]|jgi:hypothetical protein|nr:hypothetical protein [Holosporales bacterium]